MTQHNTVIEKYDLLDVENHPEIVAAFSHYEEKNIEFGLQWLQNMALTALAEDEKAILYLAKTTDQNFLALPLRLKQGVGHASSLSTFYTSLFSPIVHSEQPEPLLNELMKYLAQSETVTSLTLYPLDVGNPIFSALSSALKNARWSGIHTYPCFGNWTHSLEHAGYQHYFNNLPSRQKNTIKRKTRRFMADGSGQLLIVQHSHELPWAIDQFTHIYNRSWKKEEPFPNFIPSLMELAAKRGWLRLGIANYEGEPVAAQLWLVSNGVAHIFKLAYDEQYKKLSAGTVLTAHMMEHVIDIDQVHFIDYLTGDDRYKQDWMSHRSERRGIAAFNTRTIQGWLQCQLHRAKSFAKRFAAK